MTFYAKTSITAALLGFVTLSACVADDPEYQAEKAAMRANASKTNSQTAQAEFGPLMPICLAAIEKGSTMADAQMAQLGFSPTPVFGAMKGYKKARGEGAMDRLNFTNTSFSVGRNSCLFTLGNSAALQEGGAVLRNLLASNGYQEIGQVKGGARFQKGGTTVELNGFSMSGTVSLTIKAIR